MADGNMSQTGKPLSAKTVKNSIEITDLEYASNPVDDLYAFFTEVT